MKGMSHPVIFRLAAELPRRNDFDASLDAVKAKHPDIVLTHNGRGKSCWKCLRCGKQREDKEALKRLRCK